MDDKKLVPVEDKPAKIIKGSTKEVKKSVGKKICEFFFEENGKSVLSWLFEDVVKPGIKDLMYDFVVNGARGAFYGTGRRSRSESTSSSYERSRYENRFKSNSSDRRTANKPQRRNGGWDIEEVFEEMRDAQDVLDAMRDRIDKFGSTTVGDFFDFIGKTIPSGQYTSADWGWDNLDDVSVRHNREGFYIDLPRPVHLD
jgi:hypothetical protein